MRASTVMGIMLMCSVKFNYVKTEDCPPEIIEKCPQTEYGAYIRCLKQHRVKRQACMDTAIPCIATCSRGCTQQNCFDNCATSCQMSPVCTNCNSVFQTPTCYDSCMSSCNGYYCKETCEKKCQISTATIVQGGPAVHNTTIVEQSAKHQISASVPNVTTIIKLTNIVNNTNIVNVPTTINNTNVNNLDLKLNSSDEGKPNAAQMNDCCMVVEPKKCYEVKNDNGELVNRCVHKRHRTCGPQCLSNTMHAQVRQKCEGDQTSCPAAISYVPQPTPRCIYQQSWPYVACGYNDNQKCDGCYDHYGYGYQQYYQDDPNPPSCNGCYDDGFGVGSLYRQGPVYRPGYYHTLPCHITGSCGAVQQPLTETMDCGFGGCFGHELIDPVYGAQSYSPYTSPYVMNPYSSYYPQYVPPPMPPMPPMLPMAPMPMVPLMPGVPPMAPMIGYPPLSPMFPVPMNPSGYDLNGILPSNYTSDNNDENEIDPNSIVPQNGTIIYPYPYRPYPYGYGYRPGFNPFYRPSPYPFFNETILVQETVRNP